MWRCAWAGMCRCSLARGCQTPVCIGTHGLPHQITAVLRLIRALVSDADTGPAGAVLSRGSCQQLTCQSTNSRSDPEPWELQGNTTQ